MREWKVRAIVAASVTLCGVSGAAQAAISYTGTTLTENFDTLPSSGTTATFATPIGTRTGVPGLTSWDGTQNGGSTTTPSMNFVADNGASTAGALYSYGATLSGERALGALASGTRIGTFGLEIVNNSPLAIASVAISYTAEQWRSSTSVTNTLAFAYGSNGSFGPAVTAGYLTDVDLLAVASLNAPAKAFVTTNGLTDGNLAANQTAVSGSITLSSPLLVGQSLFIRWADTNDAGSDAGIGIDNFSFSATAVPEPASLGLIALGGLALLRRRRSTVA